jgi:hypothetical protein
VAQPLGGRIRRCNGHSDSDEAATAEMVIVPAGNVMSERTVLLQMKEWSVGNGNSWITFWLLCKTVRSDKSPTNGQNDHSPRSSIRNSIANEELVAMIERIDSGPFIVPRKVFQKAD